MIAAPTISVIVPSYNQGRFLAECLESILTQNYPALELIVMDGGSTDQSVEIIRRYEDRLSYWQSQPDGGQSAAINAGVGHARGDIVAWLNSDDLYHAGALWAVARAWAKHRNCGLYIGNGFRLDDHSKQLTRHNQRHMAFGRQALREGLDYVLQPSAFFNLADWRAVGGLNERLQFCMDWDILIRIAGRSAAVVIDEFLGVSREYEDTKTASGGFVRVEELLQMVKSHTAREMTIGGSIYAVWTLLAEHKSGDASDAFRHHVYQAQLDAARRLASLGAAMDGSPTRSDAGDATHLAIPSRDAPKAAAPPDVDWPTITVVIPSLNRAEFLERALASVLDQGYPNLELIVMDGGSTDGSVAIIERFADSLHLWRSGPDAGPASAINEGFTRSVGDVLVWLNADDMMAEGALHTVGAAFAADEELDLTYGDAMFVNANDEPVIADRGGQETSLLVGEMQQRNRIPAYWSYSHQIAQPATYFRRRLIEQRGPLDVKYRVVFDVELFFRFRDQTNIRKIDKLLAFQRVHHGSKAQALPAALTELYEFSRAWWPDRKTEAFKYTRHDFLSGFMERYWGDRPKHLSFRLHRALFAVIVTYRLGNPEQMLMRRDGRRTEGRHSGTAKGSAGPT